MARTMPRGNSPKKQAKLTLKEKRAAKREKTDVLGRKKDAGE